MLGSLNVSDAGVIEYVEGFPHQMELEVFPQRHTAGQPRIEGDIARKVESVTPQPRRSVGCSITVIVEIEIEMA